MSRTFGPRRAAFVDVSELEPAKLGRSEARALENFDLVYRTLCAMLYNFAPTSGHPGGSISSGRFVTSLLFGGLEYDIGDPARRDADMIVYAAGHKALGLYALWALRDEIMRMVAPTALPQESARRLRLEDLLGFRRNPTTNTPLFQSLNVRPLDGHPTPATPFVPLSTGASGVGLTTSVGLALAAADLYGVDDGPRVHIVEGEGGLTPGRVSEALAFAATASLSNVIVHLDWNQSSIDSDRVTREDGRPGDYVQWDPMELFYLHDWNVVQVPDGTDFGGIMAAQRRALSLGRETGQPTAIVYRTTKGWRYGIEGRKSHGAGHALCSAGFYEVLAPLLGDDMAAVPRCGTDNAPCGNGTLRERVERCYWDSLKLVRRALERDRGMVDLLAEHVLAARARLDKRGRKLRPDVPRVEDVFAAAEAADVPESLALEPGGRTTLRKQLGRTLGYLSRQSNGALLVGSADLLGSTSVSEATKDFATGYYNARANADARTLAVGGIAEDAMSGILAGVSSMGGHVGVGSSYAAFLAPLGHISARLHAIGNQARQSVDHEPYRPFILVCGHAGLKTGEDGPTHADPQPLQLLQENFPAGTMITLTPWDPQEIWPLMRAALARRPAVIAPFVTRPTETVLDRPALGLAPPEAAATGIYQLRAARSPDAGVLVLQGSEVAYAFVEDALPRLEREGLDLAVFYVASAELFDALPVGEQNRIFPESLAMRAMGITGFTLPTLYRWVRSDAGRRSSLYPYRRGHFLGSGPGEQVVAEAGLDGESQFRAIARFLEMRARRDNAAPAAEPTPVA